MQMPPGIYRSILALIFIFSADIASATTAADSSRIDFTHINEYAVLANASYTPADKITELVSKTDYVLTHHSIIPEVEIAWFLVTNPKAGTQVIAIRGTSNMNNALVDVEMKLVPDERAGIRLHRGFARAAAATYNDITDHLKKDYRISTTGHSLGGAVALILALYLDMDDYDIDQVVTFGQPKVTNISGAEKFEHLNITRVVTPRDVVPLVPPLDPLDINDLDIYWHVGREVILLDGANYAMLKGINSMLRATRFTQQQPDEENLRQHQMTRYLHMLDKKVPDAKQVPFKNSLNLFNLFSSDPE